MHFSQLCTKERCTGYWALSFEDGALGGVSLAGVRALVAFDAPQRMIDGNWTQVIVIDSAATAGQRAAVESILKGSVGGPWEVLARFVGRRLDTRILPIMYEDDGATKRASIPGLLRAVVTQIRGRDRTRPVTFDNIFNQIHAPTQVIALGDTDYDDGVIVIHNAGTHALFSRFHWVGGREA